MGGRQADVEDILESMVEKGQMLDINHSYCQRCDLHFNGLGCPKCERLGAACSCLDGKSFVPTRATLGIRRRRKSNEAVRLLCQNPKYYECRPPFEFDEVQFHERRTFRCKSCGEHFGVKLHFDGHWIRPKETNSGS